MKNTTTWIIIVLIVLIGGYFLLTPTISTEPTNKDLIKVGAILPLTGNAAYYGEMAKNGLLLAKDIIKKQLDVSVDIFFEDSAFEVKQGINGYNKLSSIEDLDMIITGASHISIATQDLIAEDNIPQFAIFSAADKYSTPNDISFRMSSVSKNDAKYIVDFVEKRGYKKLGILYVKNDFGVAYKDSIESFLNNSNTEIFSEGFIISQTDFRTQLLKIRQENIDVLFVVGITYNYVNILNQLAELNIRDSIDVISMWSFENSDVLTQANVNAEGVYYYYPFYLESQDKTVSKFITTYREKFGKNPDAYVAEGYESLRVFAYAEHACSGENLSYKNECIKKYLSEIDKKKFDSIYTDLFFNEDGDAQYPLFLKTVKNGEFVKYEPEE